MRRSLFFLFGLLLCLTSTSQDTLWINLEGLNIETPRSFNLDTVIASTSNRILGSYEGRVIVAEKDIASTIQHAHRLDDGDATSYSLQIQSITLVKDASKANHISATTVFSFYRPMGNGQFEYLNVSKTCSEKFNGKSIEPLLSGLRCAITESFDSLDYAIWKRLLAVGTEVTIPSIEEITSQYLDQPFFEGYFASYGAFVQNQMTPCRNYRLREKLFENSDTKAYKLFNDEGKRVWHKWGYSDGNQIYVNFNGYYYPLYISRNQVSTTFTAYDEWNIAKEAIAVGIITAAILAMSSGTVVIVGVVRNGKEYHLSLDHLNGSFIETDRWVQRFTPTEMYFYTAKSLKQDSVVIDINGEPICLLGGNEYFYYNSVVNNSNITFCITSPNAQQTCTDVVAFEGGLRCYYIKLKRTGVPVIDAMTPEQYSPIMRLIDDGKIKPGCSYSPTQ